MHHIIRLVAMEIKNIKNVGYGRLEFSHVRTILSRTDKKRGEQLLPERGKTQHEEAGRGKKDTSDAGV